MKLLVKKATSKHLTLVYQRGYNRVWVISSVSFFLAGLIYWFAFLSADEPTWVMQGPLLKKEANSTHLEVLFRMPNHQEQENFYVPLDESFIRHNKDLKRYELILRGRTSIKWKIDRIYEKRINTYKTKEEARKHYYEIEDFLLTNDQTILTALSSPEVKSLPTSLLKGMIPYLPFILAALISGYFLMFPVVKAELDMDRATGNITIKRSSLLIPTRQEYKLSDFEKADLIKIEQETISLLRIEIHIEGLDPILFCQYKPPYQDDKHIASLSQHTRMINWWNDDELIDKYGDSFLKG